jgi:hypothetical protein
MNWSATRIRNPHNILIVRKNADIWHNEVNLLYWISGLLC